ncbi:MAG: hypothetical protein M1830_008064 [Pleopsidium flavum]|nr:MAG: hypothetical protein M1830_010374 [Pleopsidium flavum]KAI9875734.1 MAG: hypothetical protein M1830_008064 [Pleopsidium flavum]
MPVDWKSKESFTRLLAAWWASSEDHKPNYKKIATLFGESTTYDSIEGRFRIIKKEAALLKAELESGTRTPAPLRGAHHSNNNNNTSFSSTGSQNSTPRKPRTPRTPKREAGGVVGGRVSKNLTPTKSRRGAATNTNTNTHGHAHIHSRGSAVKEELSSESSMLEELNDASADVDWMAGSPGSSIYDAHTDVYEGGSGFFEGEA